MPFVRSRIPELMDDPALDSTLHRAALRGLSRLNALACTDLAIWQRIAPIAARTPRPLRFLDVATGSGDLLIRLARRAANERASLEFTACDISATALECASMEARRANISLHMLHQDIFTTPLPAGFDIAHCGLFLHHLDPPQVQNVLGQMSRAAPVVIVQDLRRTYLGLSLATIIPQLVTRSPIVHTDAIISVRAAYTFEEMLDMAAQAGLSNASVSPLRPQRLLLYWERAA